jgi:hypothetical protein
MRPCCAQASSISAKGTSVVLPAPGGAISTAFGLSAKAARKAGKASETGKSGNMGGGKSETHPHVTRHSGAIKRRLGLGADRVQMESSERVKMLEKQRTRAGCVQPC